MDCLTCMYATYFQQAAKEQKQIIVQQKGVLKDGKTFQDNNGAATACWRNHLKQVLCFFLGRCCDSILLNPLKKSVVVLRQHYWKHYIEQVFVLFWAVSVCVCVCGVFLCVCVCDFMCCDSIYWTKHLKKSGVPCGRSIRHSMMAGARTKAARDGEKLPGHTAWAPD